MAQRRKISPATASSKPDKSGKDPALIKVTAQQKGDAFKGLPWSFRVAARLLTGIERGILDVYLPDGRAFRFEGQQAGPHGVIRAHRLNFVRSAILWGEAGFVRSYLNKAFDTPDLTALLEVMMQWTGARRSKARTPKILRLGHVFTGRMERLAHALRENSKRGSKRNILAHYDLGNKFYEAWLDPSMTYSSAVFSHEDQSLEEAQRAKYKRVAESLKLRPDSQVLEIGSGWGGFAEYAVREYGAKITSITISDAQYDYARRRMDKAGISDQADIQLCDYRDVQGQYDAVASIEMFEAVGKRYWPVYFDTLKRVLKPEGQALLQVITIDESNFDYYSRNSDFIRKYIFPGGFLPTRKHLSHAAGNAGLVVSGSYMFGKSYARTLQDWRQSFDEAWKEIIGLGFDERFARIWRMYLSYCEAGFSTASIDVGQFQLEHN